MCGSKRCLLSTFSNSKFRHLRRDESLVMTPETVVPPDSVTGC